MATPFSSADNSSSSSPLTINYSSPFDVTPGNAKESPWNASETGMVILNSPIEVQPGETENPIFEQLWRQSSFHICADGGANRLYEYVQHRKHPSSPLLPQLITGDLDSLQPHVRQFYESHNVPIVRREDQNYNDLDKSIKALLELSTKKNASSSHFRSCFIYGAFGGRFDQEMASLQALFVHTPTFSKGLWLCDHANVALLLMPHNQHVFHLQKPPSQQSSSLSIRRHFRLGPTCGLIPIGAPCPSVTTMGLQWNLENDALAFGGLVSTSNCIVQDTVAIHTTQEPLLFSMEITTHDEEQDGK